MDSYRVSLPVRKAHVPIGAIIKYKPEEKARLGALGLLHLYFSFYCLWLSSSLFSCGQLLLELVHSCQVAFPTDIPTTLCCFLNWRLHGRWRKWPSKYTGRCERAARLMAVLAVCLQADTRLEITQRLNFPDQLVSFLFLLATGDQ